MCDKCTVKARRIPWFNLETKVNKMINSMSKEDVEDAEIISKMQNIKTALDWKIMKINGN